MLYNVCNSLSLVYFSPNLCLSNSSSSFRSQLKCHFLVSLPWTYESRSNPSLNATRAPCSLSARITSNYLLFSCWTGSSLSTGTVSALKQNPYPHTNKSLNQHLFWTQLLPPVTREKMSSYSFTFTLDPIPHHILKYFEHMTPPPAPQTHTFQSQ